MVVSLALRKLIQKGHKLRANLGNMEKICLKKQKIKATITRQDELTH